MSGRIHRRRKWVLSLVGALLLGGLICPYARHRHVGGEHQHSHSHSSTDTAHDRAHANGHNHHGHDHNHKPVHNYQNSADDAQTETIDTEATPHLHFVFLGYEVTVRLPQSAAVSEFMPTPEPVSVNHGISINDLKQSEFSFQLRYLRSASSSVVPWSFAVDWFVLSRSTLSFTKRQSDCLCDAQSVTALSRNDQPPTPPPRAA